MAIIPWKIIDSRYLIRDPWMVLRSDRCETASGVTVDPYYVQEPPDWVQIVAFDCQDRILLIQQYRHGAGVISTELPCGNIDSGEAPAKAAQRELLEETGCGAETFLPLPVSLPNPARFSNKVHAFVALNTQRLQTQDLDPTEQIEFDFRTVSEVLALIDSGAFMQTLHIGSVFQALRMRQLIVLNTTPVPRT